ncbi:methyltransferase [Hoyosella subflava]|uniref:Hydroxyneurosporene-O-methyltransferase n=1 Tax=Hoyosella subflava (strain DSM 45089 / JCM 17490 / NBRC 109087 / DQS3-9A1) TaxID=443218 RepID=F6EK30_HOYSD|nr:methyltransferase [Hoyosella subflava]AEF41388.1 Hydroxyneurosporene-O-methyltransferase [Hoyosella subflava DQS3-9A1]
MDLAAVRWFPPVRVVRAVELVRSALTKLTQLIAPSPVNVLELATGSWVTQAVYTATKLGIPDALAGGPLTAEEIAEKVGADSDGTHRLLRALAAKSVFREGGDGRFELTAMGQSLRSDAADSVRPLVLMIGHPAHWEHWGGLLYSVQTGKSSLEQLRGLSAFDFFEENEEVAQVFNDAMTVTSEMVIGPVLAAYDFTKYRTIVDVGGGHGRLLAAILQQSPDSRGVLFELPPVLPGACDLFVDAGVADRTEAVGGSFFESVPADGDAYVLKNIVHDWPEEQAIEILRNVRAAMPDEGRVLLIEAVIPEGNGEHVSKWLNLEMLIQTGGRERTVGQYSDLLEHAGLKLSRVVPTIGPASLIEAIAR